jgi:hypothetical protein
MPKDLTELDKIRLAGMKFSLPGAAIVCMGVAILSPAVLYAIKLRDPRPAELLVTISISLFSSVVFLWILDATGILRFRSEWVSRSVYTAAIVSVLGTSVGVYKDYFSPSKFPLEGAWKLTLISGSASAEHTLLMAYSRDHGEYWGYSDVTKPASPAVAAALSDRCMWLELHSFTPDDGKIAINCYAINGVSERIASQLQKQTLSRWLSISNHPVKNDAVQIELTRWSSDR